MRPFRNSAFGASLLLAAGLTGCGSSGPLAPSPGTLSLAMKATLPTGSTTVSAGSITFENLSVFGDVRPDDHDEHTETPVDLLAPAPFSTLSPPQGLYSAVRFTLDAASLDGTFQGTPLHAQFGEAFELHGIFVQAAKAKEVEPGEAAQFQLAVDVTQWFDDAELGQADRENGTILIDPTHNVTLARLLPFRIAASFALQ